VGKSTYQELGRNEEPPPTAKRSKATMLELKHDFLRVYRLFTNPITDLAISRLCGMRTIAAIRRSPEMVDPAVA